MSELKMPWGDEVERLMKDGYCKERAEYLAQEAWIANQSERLYIDYRSLRKNSRDALMSRFADAVRFGAEQAEAKYSRLIDPTPLSELSDEQLKSTGLIRCPRSYHEWQYRSPIDSRVNLTVVPDAACVWVSNSLTGTELGTTVKTIGQLNCLMMGLEAGN